MAGCRDKPQYSKALSTSIQERFGRPVQGTISPQKSVNSSGHSSNISANYNANVRIRNPPYVFPKTQLEEVFSDQIGKYSIAPHLTRSRSSQPAKKEPLPSKYRKYIDYTEFSRSLSACLFNGFNDTDSYRCSMNQAIHSPHVFAQQRLIRQEELDEWTRCMSENNEVQKSNSKKLAKSTTSQSMLKKDPVDFFNAYRRRNDPVLKQEERIYNQDQLMKSLK